MCLSLCSISPEESLEIPHDFADLLAGDDYLYTDASSGSMMTIFTDDASGRGTARTGGRGRWSMETHGGRGPTGPGDGGRMSVPTRRSQQASSTAHPENNQKTTDEDERRGENEGRVRKRLDDDGSAIKVESSLSSSSLSGERRRPGCLIHETSPVAGSPSGKDPSTSNDRVSDQLDLLSGQKTLDDTSEEASGEIMNVVAARSGLTSAATSLELQLASLRITGGIS
jgi:hypothetical protein